MAEENEPECLRARDCILEVDNITVLRACYSLVYGNDQVDFCDCENYFGFIGNKCDEPTIQTRSIRGILGLHILVSAVGIVISLILLNRYLKLDMNYGTQTSAPKRGTNTTKYILYILVLGLISFLLEIIRSIASFIALIDTQFIRISEAFFALEEFDLLTGPLRGATIACLTLSLYFACLMLITMLFYWLSIVSLSTIEEKRLLRIQMLRKRTVIISIILSIILIFGISFQLTILINLLGLVFAFMVSVLCWKTRNLFLDALQDLKNRRDVAELSSLINRYSYSYVFGSIALSAAFLTMALFGALASRIEPGVFNLFWNTIEVAYIFKTFVVLYTLGFIKKILSQLNKNNSTLS